MTETIDAASLEDRVAELVDAARKAGADAADAAAMLSRSAGVSVRLGKVESTEAAESEDISLRVFVGRRVASVSANAGADTARLAERAVAMAKASPEDPFAGLADEARLARTLRDLDLYDATEVSADAAEGGGARRRGGRAGGFRRHQFRRQRRRCAATAVWCSPPPAAFSASMSPRASRAPSAPSPAKARAWSATTTSRPGCTIPISMRPRRSAARPASAPFAGSEHARPRPAATPSIYDPRVARGIAGHLAGAINGASVARKTSFLRDMMGKQVAANGITVTDDPLKPRGQASRPFDGEGIEGKPLTMVDARRAVALVPVDLDGARTRPARPTAAACARHPRSIRARPISPSKPGDASPEELIAGVGTGFYVTEVFGQGVNMVTGEYSRGASGVWIENGELTYPVSEVTIASNLKQMFMNMTPASDLDRNFGTAAPTLLIEGMTLAGS